MDVLGLSAAELAVAPSEALGALGVDEGNSDILSPSQEIVDSLESLRTKVRAAKLLEESGSMTKDELRAVLAEMLEMAS